MTLVRNAVAADKARLREIWCACFGEDSKEFVDWFFENRFFPSLASCLEVDGEIVSALQSCPLHVRIRGAILPASMLAGVSTLPEHGGKGYMKQIFLHYMQSVRAQGMPIVVHTPAHLSTFFSRGHYPATDTRHFELEHAFCQALPDGVREQSLSTGLAPLQSCYQRAFCGYSGIVSRSIADIAFKFADYASDGARCYALWREGDVCGYCVYFEDDEVVRAEELAALDDEAARTLIEALCFAARGRAVQAKLPHACGVEYPNARAEVRPQGVMGVANVSALLSGVLGDGSLRFDVRDETVPQNAGVWNGRGEAEARPPHFSLEAGRLGQLLCGYASAAELSAQGLLAAYDEGALRELDARLPKLPCYIVDEY